MEARSTNTVGYVHYGGDVVAGVNDGIAVHLRSASTGAAAIIEPLSDSDTAALTIRAKGAAALTVGNSSGSLELIGSGFTIKGAYSTTFGYTLSSGVVAGAQFVYAIASTTADIQPGDLFNVEQAETTATIALVGTRTSTAAASRVTVTMVNYSSTTLTTQALTGRVTWLDLT